jgi:phosphatidylserine/phosphatidylglycerophosphate/cardiolipin synthase-like enzyme
MRKTARSDGFSVKAYAGTTGVLLAMNVDSQKRKGLLGFAIKRRAGRSAGEWLSGMLHFPHQEHRPGEPIPTNIAPVQKFRWSDYRVYPDSSYRYTVHPVHGEPDQPSLGEGLSVSVRTSSTERGQHAVLFNRAAAASQAFSRKFPEVEAALNKATGAKKKESFSLPDDVLDWLSRGVLEQILGLIEEARDSTWGLDVAIYEYELPAIVSAIRDAHRRGVNVRIVYHAKRGDPQTEENVENLRSLPRKVKRARVTSRICHHKFIVLSKVHDGERTPKAVLCGSTNFTENGVYRQGNVVHVVRRRAVAERYLELFEILFEGASSGETRDWIEANNRLDETSPVCVGFSPRSRPEDLETFQAIVQGAERDVLFCTAFDLDDGIEAALLGKAKDPILRYGLENSRSKITGFHRDKTASFTATAMLNRGLEGFLKESTKGQRGNILIHTKLLVVDFTSDNPTIISGSHNLSMAASLGNDENFMIIRGDTDVADCYGVELMRLYDHYRFRFVNRESPQVPMLTPSDEWTTDYFKRGTLHYADRNAFGA